MLKMKSPSYSQDKIKILSDMVCDNIESLLETLGIDDYKILDNMIVMSCPIHGGDNASAFNLYYTGDSYRGNWKCRSHKCEDIFKSSVIGFIRGCLSRSECNWEKNGDLMVSFQDALDFASRFTNQDLKSIKVSTKQKEKHSFVNTVRYINSDNQTNKEQSPEKLGVPRDLVLKNLTIPSPYFLSRNFDKNILIKYDVGECYIEGKEMFNRAVVPIYDINHKFMVGCSGRSLGQTLPKWKHSTGFKSENSLYNYWYAKQIIKDSGVVVLVESPGNVWKLEEAGIHNSVGLFGSSLADKQKMLLDISGAMTIITIMDNDEAGHKASEQITKKCHRTYNVKNIKIQNYNDIGEMPMEEIESQIVNIIKEYL